jgi:DNA repair photolyase
MMRLGVPLCFFGITASGLAPLVALSAKRGTPFSALLPRTRCANICSMRWDNLRIDGEEERNLPGYRDPAVVRRFDAPEALNTNFYEVRAKSALNRVPKASRMPFRWTINPYRGCTHACLYCFARPTHTYLDFNARKDFERQIVVKVNAPELVRAETRRPSWKRELVALGTNTDPYQWVEGRYKLMPGIWEALRDSRTPCSVLTKSPLVTRDVALLKEMSDMGLFSAAFSVPTIDEKAWRASEPRTPNPYARLEAAAELSRNGIAVSVLVAPLMPGINDDPRQVEKILELAADAGVVSVTGIHLHLRGEVKDITMDWLGSYRPDLVPRYERLYGRGAYAPPRERDRISALVKDTWAKVAPGRAPKARYVRTADDPASHRVPEAAQEDLQEALF